MYLVICCKEYMKFKDLWDFKKHLTQLHQHTEQEADRRVLELIEESKEARQWQVA